MTSTPGQAGAAATAPDPRRILLVGNARSIHIARWANALAGRGLEVHLATLTDPDGQTYDPRVEIHLLPGGVGRGYVLAAPRLRQLARSLRPDVVNAHYASGYGLLTRLALVGVPVAYVLSVWGSDVYDVPGQGLAQRLLLQRNLARPDVIASTSHAMADVTRKLTRTPILITPFGIDLTQFPPVHNFRESPEEFVIGTVKTMATKYGIDTLIRAFAQVVEARSAQTQLRLVLVGDGPETDQLQDLARQLGVADRVEFTGPVPHTRVPEMLARMDVYVALSRLDSESFGVAILEAAACGLPAVVSDASGPAEVTLDGRTGIIVPREDTQAAARAILTLVDDPAARAAMARQARRHVEESYDWEHCVDLMIDAYREALASRLTTA